MVSSPPSSLRVVPIAEQTPSPGASSSSSSYPLCSTVDSSAFQTAILATSNECAVKTSYDWRSALLPTAAERRELCSCTALIQQLQHEPVPRCSLVRDGTLYSYKQVVEFAFGLCSVSGSSSGASATTASPSLETSAAPSADGTGVESSGKSSSNVGLIAGVVVGVALVVAIALFVAFRLGRKRRNGVKGSYVEEGADVVDAAPLSPLETTSGVYTGVVASPKKTATRETATQRTTGTTASYGAKPTDLGIWDDPAVLAVRIPHDAIFFGPLLSRGGYGEVFKGTYKGQTVAIKQLLPERRKDVAQINAFLGEIKLMSTMEHERIVRFIGVAWNSLSDACVVVEYMENGDLRSVLNHWDSNTDGELRPQGFDSDKIKIALHIAHALTYLHSLQPVVVHRDLKSKNILLNASYDAKLTDFGVSRERADSTMTAGVGSSLWMAPEVMLGERYDEKADVFSFGVVLSELDTHKLPYSQAKEASSDRSISDAAVLQLVSLGRLTVSFSDHADPEIVQLGRECVELDPKQRPNSAEVLHRVHQAMRGRFY